jgi:CRISPR-associated exonuclease Cas4
MTEENSEIQLSAISQYSYCPRRFYLIYLETEFEDNTFTLQGSQLHDKVDRSDESNSMPGVRIERALRLRSTEYNLYGKADIVEFREDGSIFPIEYKRGKKRHQTPDDRQLCAQALCLEEMFDKPIESGAIFYGQSRRRRDVHFDARLRDETISTIHSIADLIRNQGIPPPANDSRCRHCSIKNICQPSALLKADGFSMNDIFLLDKED